MGCCFSKELSRDNSEKTALLEKSVEEEEPEKQISQTLSLLFDALDGEQLHKVGNGAGCAAGAQPCGGVLVQPMHTRAHRSPHLPNSLSSAIPTFSDRPVQTSGSVVCDTVCRDTDSDEALPLVPESLGWGLQEVALVRSRACPSTCASLDSGGKPARKGHIRSHDENGLPEPFAREVEGENCVCVDLTSGRNSVESGFYSICVLDPACLHHEEELTATTKCCSAVPGRETPQGAWPLTQPSQGSGHLECLPGMPEPNEMKEVKNDETQLSTHSDLPCRVNTGDLQAESLRANVYPGFPKDYPESRALHNAGIHSELNISTGTDSLTCVCAIPEEQVRSGQVIPGGDSHVHFTNSAPGVGRNHEFGAGAVTVGQNLPSEKDFTAHLRDTDGFLLEVNRLDSSFLAVRPDGINPSPQRCTTEEGFGNMCLPVLTGFQETDPHRLDLNPGPRSLLWPQMTEAQPPGQDSNLAAGTPHSTNEALPLWPKGSPSPLGKAEVGPGKGAYEWAPPYQWGLCVDMGAGPPWAQICAGRPEEQETDTEGVFESTDTPENTNSQPGSPNGTSLDDSKCSQNHFISSTILVSCLEEQKCEIDLNSKAEGEMCFQRAEGDPHRFKTGKDSLKVSPKETVGHDIEDVRTESRTALEGEISAQNCSTLPRQQSLAWVTAVTTACLDLEADQMERNDDAWLVDDGGSVSQGEGSCAQEGSPVCSEEKSALPHVSLESAVYAATSGDGASPGVSDPQGADPAEDLDACSDYAHRVHVTNPCGTSRHMLTSRNRDTTLSVSPPTFCAKVDFVGSPKVAFGKRGLCDTSQGQTCLVGVVPTNATSHSTSQSDSTLPTLSSVRDCVVTHSEDVGHKPDSQSCPEELYCQLLNEQSCYPTKELASQMYPEDLASGCGCPVDCVWADASGEGAVGRENICGENLYMEIQDWVAPLLWMQKPPYPPPMAADVVIWNWQNSGQLVSMILKNNCFGHTW